MKQVVTEADTLNAMFDYMTLQFDGRFRLEFPEHEEDIDAIIDNLIDPQNRQSADRMLFLIMTTVASFGSNLTVCMVSGCPFEKNHRFLREVINLIWDSRKWTDDWLKGRGIVPGQSTN